MEIFKQVRLIDFVKYSNYGLWLSVALLAVAVFLFIKPGFTAGIDFAGGSSAQLRYEGKAPIEQVRALLEPVFKGVQVSEFDSAQELLVKIPNNAELEGRNLAPMLESTLAPSGSFEIRKLDSVGAKVGAELKEKGIVSLLLAFIAMMVYVSFRYEWRFALAGILALIHDVIITAASVVIFDIDVNLEVVAALLTLIGYSINDTIIIFDRIREKMLNDKTNDIALVINEAISHTLSRTLLTSLTVFFVVLTLYVFGGSIIVGFSLPMLVGVIVGTYSSMFLAPKLAILLGFDIEKYHNKELEKQKRAKERARIRQQYEGGRV
ncbi:protein translocase subunit SecF [Helicobacter zhangjianzhongii]|uniref:Protein translocase subunit SecF n=1 Tax=Helicobacter zhangjianzhongii TaxID=2974574 RepID=A0ACC6FQ15_9HELI|nr:MULTISPECIES: protein translocase subunit SecF [unclassified Helicobacter]MDL0079288.1 protein translocase subunit SecF [Helicobacter sp. CPD2-1]MDL0081319.1 protein translocase subunit SecF [Helicobacter sp. XJK30-2]